MSNADSFVLSTRYDVVSFQVSPTQVRIVGADTAGCAPERVSVVTPEEARVAWRKLMAEGYRRDFSYG